MGKAIYGVTKATGEIMGRMCADRFGLSVSCVRLGWYVRNIEEASRVESVTSGTRSYLSNGDAHQFFVKAVAAEHVSLAAVSVASKNGGRALFDVEPPRALLGYEPRADWPEGSRWSSETHFPSRVDAPSLIPDPG